LQELSRKCLKGFKLLLRSGGTEAYNIGKEVHPLAKRVGKENGIDLSNHIARQITNEDVQSSDLIIVMDHENKKRVVELFGKGIEPKVHLLMSYSLNNDADIPDPYKRPYYYYQRTFQMIQEGCLHLIEYLASQSK